jgi:hypothetical protein
LSLLAQLVVLIVLIFGNALLGSAGGFCKALQESVIVIFITGNPAQLVDTFIQLRGFRFVTGSGYRAIRVGGFDEVLP